MPALVPQLLLVAGAIALAALAVMLLRTLLLVLGAVLIALLLQTIASKLSGWVHVRYGIVLTVVVALGLGLCALGIVFAGPSLVSQIDELSSELRSSADSLLQTLRSSQVGSAILERSGLSSFEMPSLSTIVSGATSVMRVAVEVIVVIALGLFIAASPGLYVQGVRRLIPPSRRAQGDELLESLAHALRWWLVGRLSSMAIVGVLTTIGLLALSMPLAVTLGVLAALLCFIPYVGPLLSALPALLIALAESPTKVLMVGALYAGVQFVESYLITPLIQLRAVSIPPAVLILAQVVMALFAGALGVLMATPAAVVVIVTIQVLYVRGALRESVSPLGH